MSTDSTNAARQRRRRESGARPALTGITVPRELRDAMDARAAELDIPTSHLWERAARWFLLTRTVQEIDPSHQNKR